MTLTMLCSPCCQPTPKSAPWRDGADPDALPDGFERRGRIYSRGRLSLRKRAISPKGLVTSLAAAASEIGGLLAVGSCAVLARNLDVAQLDEWGWRIPFLFGGALAGAVWVTRNIIVETPLFHGQPVGEPAAIRPLIYVLRNETRGIALGFAISALGSITYYVGITYVPSFLATAGRGNEAQALEFSSIAAVVVIAVTPCFGWLSDLAGRKPVLLGLCLACVILPVAMFHLIASGSTEAAFAAVVILAVSRRRRQRGRRDGDRRTIF